MNAIPRKRPKVSVLMITYNHEQFIEQAVRSVMMQETDFDYELVIGEDRSTDRTHEIVLALKDEFPDKIHLLLPEANLGMTKNFIETYSQCDGEYIAFCDGDDYWSSPQKLQMQVDELEDDPRCVICFHAARVVDQTSGNTQIHTTKFETLETTYSLNDFVFGRIKSGIPTASVMSRKVRDNLPDWFLELRGMCDLPYILYTLQATGGSIRFLPEEMSVYRLHDNGIWTNNSRANFIAKKNNMNNDYLVMCKKSYGQSHSKYYHQVAFSHLFQLMLFYMNENSIRASWSTTMRLFRLTWLPYYNAHFLKSITRLILLTFGVNKTIRFRPVHR